MPIIPIILGMFFAAYILGCIGKKAKLSRT